MKILVFSDSHNNPTRMDEAIKAQMKHGLDYVFFLGDGITDFDRVRAKHPGPEYHGVLGNCDTYSYRDEGVWEQSVDVDGRKFLLMHGHRYEDLDPARGGSCHRARCGCTSLRSHAREMRPDPRRLKRRLGARHQPRLRRRMVRRIVRADRNSWGECCLRVWRITNK